MTTKIRSSNFNDIVSLSISGGSIENTIIGANTAASGTFTDLSVNTDLFVSDKIIHIGDTDTSIRFPAADTMAVETAGTERFRVTSTGNVGIGLNSPATRLQVRGAQNTTILALEDGSEGNFRQLKFTSSTNGQNWDINSQGTSGGLGGILTLSTLNSERIRISNNGNISIGTANASVASGTGLVVFGSGVARLALRNSTTGDTATDGSGVFISDSDFGIENREGGNIIFYSPTERMRIDGSGNVGIGVTSPTATLHVNGTVAGTFLSSQAQAQTGTDNTTVMTPLRTAQAIASQIVLVGQVSFFAQSTAPTGWLKANGALVSRTTFAALFSAIGTTFGAGDGSTTFALPDLRGEFPRGWDDGRGADSGRVFGSAQGDAIRNITGNFSAGKFVSASGAFNVDSVTQSGDGSQQTGGNFSFSAARVVPTAAENRPRNVALLACIKF
jgi:hypothetical protein